LINFKAEQKRFWSSVNLNLPQPEKLVKIRGKHRYEKNLDNNEKADKNASGLPNGKRCNLPGIANSRRRIVVGVAVIHPILRVA